MSTDNEKKPWESGFGAAIGSMARYPVTCNYCGNPAFYFNREIIRGNRIEAVDIISVMGEAVISGERMLCGSCGLNLGGNFYRSENNYFVA